MRLRKTGFTLIEMMVASTIGAFVMLVAVGTLRAITASSQRMDESINSAAEVRFAARMLTNDLVNFYRDQNMENTKFIGTVGDSEQGGTTSYLVFYTISRIKARPGRPEGDIYEVEYYLVEDEEGNSRLMRRMWPNPNKEDTEPGGILAVIAEDIEVFQIRYYDGEEWSTEWPEEMEVLPQLVEVSIVAKPESKQRPVVETLIVNLTRSVTASVETTETNEQQQGGQGSGGQSGQQGTSGQGNQGGGGQGNQSGSGQGGGGR